MINKKVPRTLVPVYFPGINTHTHTHTHTHKHFISFLWNNGFQTSFNLGILGTNGGPIYKVHKRANLQWQWLLSALLCQQLRPLDRTLILKITTLRTHLHFIIKSP